MELINAILSTLISFIEHVITTMGPCGISLLMAIESCNIPLPSEAVLPFAGYIVSKGEMNLHVAAFASAIGCVLGSIPSYYLGYFGGRKFVEKYGKYFLVSKKDLEEAIEVVIAGEQKKGSAISNKERMIVSYHEIGHALVAARCQNRARRYNQLCSCGNSAGRQRGSRKSPRAGRG